MSDDERFEKYVDRTGSTQIGAPPKTLSELSAMIRNPIKIISSVGALYLVLWRAGIFDLTPD